MSTSVGAPPCANHPDRPHIALCGRCGDFICAACARGHEDGGVYCPRCIDLLDEHEGDVPWEAADRPSALSGWWDTAREGTFSPALLYARINPRGPYGAATLFALINLYISVGSSVLVEVPSLLLGLGTEAAAFDDFGAPPIALQLVLLLLGAALLPLALLVIFYVQAGVYHLFAMLFGADSAGFRGTFRAVVYSSGVLVFSAMVGLVIGLLGLLLGLAAPDAMPALRIVEQLVTLGFTLYSVGLLISAFRAVQRTSWGRAMAVILLPFGLAVLALCGCGVGLATLIAA